MYLLLIEFGGVRGGWITMSRVNKINKEDTGMTLAKCLSLQQALINLHGFIFRHEVVFLIALDGVAILQPCFLEGLG